MPQGFMRVVYRAGGRDGKEVHWGNIISAEEVHTTYSVQDEVPNFPVMHIQLVFKYYLYGALFPVLENSARGRDNARAEGESLFWAGVS